MSMKTMKLKHFYLSILICVLVLNFLMTVSTAKIISGVERLEEGIVAYEHGEYDDAIFKLEMAIYQIPAEEKDQLWDAHFYLGLSYLLIGDADESTKQFSKAREIFSNKTPDPAIHSPKIAKLFKEALKFKKIDIEMIVNELGIEVKNMSIGLAGELGYEGEKGVVVSNVKPGSPGQLAELREDDLIMEVNREIITNVKEYGNALMRRGKNKDFLFSIRRKSGASPWFIVVENKRKPASSEKLTKILL